MDEKKPVDPPEKLHIEQVNLEVKDVTDYSKITDEFRQSRKGQINNILQNAFQTALKEVAETFPSEGEYAAVSDLENAILLQVFQVMTKEVRKEEGSVPGMSIDEDVFPELTVFIATQWWSNHNKAAIGGLSKEELKNHLQHIKALIPYLQKQVTDEVSLNDLVQEIDLYGNPEKKAKHAAAIKKAVIEMESNENSQIIPYLNSIVPSRHTIANTKFSNELAHDFVDRGEQRLIVGGDKSHPVYTYASVTSDFALMPDFDEKFVLKGKQYTEFDRSVSDAIISLYMYGHSDHNFTADMVYRQMTHKTESEHISQAQRNAVTESIEKQRRIHAEILATEELKRHNARTPDGQAIEGFDGNLLEVRGAWVRSGGQLIKCYYFMAEPLQLVYAKLTNQLITVDAKLLDIKEVDKHGNLSTRSIILRKEYCIPVRNYIIRRIEIMKNDQKKKSKTQSSHICYDQLYKIADIDVTDRKSTERVRSYIYKILDFFKAYGYIADYKKITRNRCAHAVDIILPPSDLKSIEKK